jgi:hypothetical protein
MKFAKVAIGWTPGGDVEVVSAHELHSAEWSNKHHQIVTSPAYRSDLMGISGVSAQLAALVHFHMIVVRDNIDPMKAHKAFMDIDEYRDTVAADTLPARCAAVGNPEQTARASGAAPRPAAQTHQRGTPHPVEGPRQKSCRVASCLGAPGDVAAWRRDRAWSSAGRWAGQLSAPGDEENRRRTDTLSASQKRLITSHQVGVSW